jgi:hypothetical protein
MAFKLKSAFLKLFSGFGVLYPPISHPKSLPTVCIYGSHLNVIHNLGLEEGLGCIVHDFVAQLGLGDVLAELLDTSSLWWRSVLVNNLKKPTINFVSQFILASKTFNRSPTKTKYSINVTIFAVRTVDASNEMSILNPKIMLID